MHDTITTEYFKLIKGCVERKLDARNWSWSTKDSMLLDWCVWNVEATDDH